METAPIRTATNQQRRRPRLRRAGLLTTPLAGIALLAAACSGGTPSASVAHTGSTTSTTAPSSGSGSAGSGSGGVTVAYSACMRSHGVPNFPDPNSQGGISIKASSGSGGSGIDPNSPQYLAAQKDCAKLAPSAGTPAQQAQNLANAVKYSACMRSHGVSNFPDPTVVNGQIAFAGQQGLGRSPNFQTAQNACQSVLNGGSGS